MTSPGRSNSRLLQLAALVWMGRPLFVPGGVLAYALGVAMGYWRLGTWHPGRALAGLALAETVHLVAHYANEYADAEADAHPDVRRTWLSGGSGVLPAGLLPAAWALRLAVALSILALILATALIAAGLLPLPVAWIAGLGLAGSWFYSMPPVQLQRRGLGELDTALTAGLLMPLLGYTVQVGHVTPAAVAALLPISALVLVNLLAVHWSDRLGDAAAGKRTIPVLAGAGTRLWHHGALAVAYLLILALTGWILPLPVTGGLLLALPASLWAGATFRRQFSPLPATLAMTATMAAAAAGWVTAAWGF